jgi:hypothetical protein
MLNPNRQRDGAGEVTGGTPALETIEQWLRGLASAEIRELSEALANNNSDKLTRFRTRFQAWLDRTG